MTLQQLKYILTIVECGSISEAAKQLYVSQPSLSNAVKELEQELAIDIFLRSTKGITLTNDGVEFISYARQIIEQAELMEQRYLSEKQPKKLCSISTQHYAFAVQAFVALLNELNESDYECKLRETRTSEIIDDVSNFRSEVGILFLSSFNEKVLTKMMNDKGVTFTPLFEAMPHIFISDEHPLANRSEIKLEELDQYPFLAFEQGELNSFYFAEELLSTHHYKKKILVSDRATLFNLLIGLNGYTISSGVLNSDLNGEQIKSVRIDTKERMLIGYLINEKAVLSPLALRYIEKLKQIITEFGFSILQQK